MWAEDMDEGTLAQLMRAYMRRKTWEAGGSALQDRAPSGARQVSADALVASMTGM